MPNADDKMKAALSAAAKRQALKAKKAAAPEAKPPEPIAPEKPPIPKPESQSAPAASKKEDIFDIIKSVFTAWWVFIKKDYRAYFLELLKIHLVQIIVGLGIVILFCLIGFGAYMGVMALNLAQFWIPLAILALIFIILAYIFSSTVLQSIALSAIPMTEARLGGGSLSLGKSFMQIKGKVLNYVLLNTGIGLVVCIPAIIIMCLPFLSYLFMPAKEAAIVSIMGFFVSYLVMWAYLMVVLLLYSFFLQFWQLGFLLQGLGVKESLISSYKLVRSRLLDILIFDIVFMVLMWLASIPMMVVYMAAYVGLILTQLMVIFAPFIGLVLALAGIVVFILILIIFMTLLQMVSLPVVNLFWKKIRG